MAASIFFFKFDFSLSFLKYNEFLQHYRKAAVDVRPTRGFKVHLQWRKSITLFFLFFFLGGGGFINKFLFRHHLCHLVII